MRNVLLEIRNCRPKKSVGNAMKTLSKLGFKFDGHGIEFKSNLEDFGFNYKNKIYVTIYSNSTWVFATNNHKSIKYKNLRSFEQRVRYNICKVTTK